MFHDRLFQGQFANINANTPLATSSLATGTATSPLPFRLTDAVPVNAAIPTVYVIDPTVRNPYTQRYNVALERLLRPMRPGRRSSPSDSISEQRRLLLRPWAKRLPPSKALNVESLLHAEQRRCFCALARPKGHPAPGSSRRH
jgi:hypothetical protein